MGFRSDHGGYSASNSSGGGPSSAGVGSPTSSTAISTSITEPKSAKTDIVPNGQHRVNRDTVPNLSASPKSGSKSAERSGGPNVNLALPDRARVSDPGESSESREREDDDSSSYEYFGSESSEQQYPGSDDIIDEDLGDEGSSYTTPSITSANSASWTPTIASTPIAGGEGGVRTPVSDGIPKLVIRKSTSTLSGSISYSNGSKQTPGALQPDAGSGKNSRKRRKNAQGITADSNHSRRDR